jgi:hypothetical protein
MAEQDNWRWCRNCYCLWYNGAQDNGHCPAPNAPKGGHVSNPSGDYILIWDPNR